MDVLDEEKKAGTEAPEPPPSSERPEQPAAAVRGPASRAVDAAAKAAVSAARRLFASLEDAGQRAASADAAALAAIRAAEAAQSAEEIAQAAASATRAAEDTAKVSARASRTARVAAVLERAVLEAERERPEDAMPPKAQPKPAPDAAPVSGTETLIKRVRRFERSVKDYQYLILRLLLILLLVWVLFFAVVGVTRMPSDEMYPRVDAGDLVLFYRLDREVSAQDIVVLRKALPDSAEEELFVLRVVAVEGDTVEISDSEHLLINGSAMIETNIFYPTPRYEGFTEYPLTLGQGECFVLADRRDGGTDSRYFGPVKRSELIGTVITILRRNNL